MHGFSNDESRLVKTLIDDYAGWNPARCIRPLANSSEAIEVDFRLSLQKLVNYDDNIATVVVDETMVGWSHFIFKYSSILNHLSIREGALLTPLCS